MLKGMLHDKSPDFQRGEILLEDSSPKAVNSRLTSKNYDSCDYFEDSAEKLRNDYNEKT